MALLRRSAEMTRACSCTHTTCLSYVDVDEQMSLDTCEWHRVSRAWSRTEESDSRFGARAQLAERWRAPSDIRRRST